MTQPDSDRAARLRDLLRRFAKELDREGFPAMARGLRDQADFASTAADELSREQNT